MIRDIYPCEFEWDEEESNNPSPICFTCYRE